MICFVDVRVCTTCLQQLLVWIRNSGLVLQLREYVVFDLIHIVQLVKFVQLINYVMVSFGTNRTSCTEPKICIQRVGMAQHFWPATCNLTPVAMWRLKAHVSVRGTEQANEGSERSFLGNYVERRGAGTKSMCFVNPIETGGGCQSV